MHGWGTDKFRIKDTEWSMVQHSLFCCGPLRCRQGCSCTEGCDNYVTTTDMASVVNDNVHTIFCLTKGKRAFLMNIHTYIRNRTSLFVVPLWIISAYVWNTEPHPTAPWNRRGWVRLAEWLCRDLIEGKTRKVKGGIRDGVSLKEHDEETVTRLRGLQ